MNIVKFEYVLQITLTNHNDLETKTNVSLRKNQMNSLLGHLKVLYNSECNLLT